MLNRLLYLIFARICSWLVLVSRSGQGPFLGLQRARELRLLSAGLPR